MKNASLFIYLFNRFSRQTINAKKHQSGKSCVRTSWTLSLWKSVRSCKSIIYSHAFLCAQKKFSRSTYCIQVQRIYQLNYIIWANKSISFSNIFNFPVYSVRGSAFLHLGFNILCWDVTMAIVVHLFHPYLLSFFIIWL